jgi:hypothetical protein
MNLTFNLVALLNVLVAVAGVWTALPETRGRAVKLWRLGMPPFFCTMASIIMLANTQALHVVEAMWMGAAVGGAVIGVIAGSRVKISTDQMWGLVQLKPTYVGILCAVGVLLMVLADSTALWMGIASWPPGKDPAIWAALLSGVLDGRGWRMAANAVRSPHADLNID